MKDFFQSLPDGWTIYVWMVAGGLIILAAIIGIRWAHKNEQFDEDIKYLVFDEKDQEKMDPEEFAKSQEVNRRQEERRVEVLKENEAERRAAQNKRNHA